MNENLLFWIIENENERPYGFSHEMYRKECAELGVPFNEATHQTLYKNAVIKHPSNETLTAVIINNNELTNIPEPIIAKLKDYAYMVDNGWFVLAAED
jgi:hypothetical protein